MDGAEVLGGDALGALRALALHALQEDTCVRGGGTKAVRQMHENIIINCMSSEGNIQHL